MEITVSQEQGKVPVTVMHLRGNLDSATSQDFQARAEQLLAAGARNLVLNLREVPYMSSAGLRVLNQLYSALRHGAESQDVVTKGVSAGTYKSPHLKLVAPNSRVLETLKMSGFDMFLEIHPNVSIAVASF